MKATLIILGILYVILGISGNVYLNNLEADFEKQLNDAYNESLEKIDEFQKDWDVLTPANESIFPNKQMKDSIDVHKRAFGERYKYTGEGK